MLQIFKDYKIDGVVHLAAESHVDRSIKDPFTFAKTNILGTLSLLQAAKECWNGNHEGKLFYHISTDEVYGALEEIRQEVVRGAETSFVSKQNMLPILPTRQARHRATIL